MTYGHFDDIAKEFRRYFSSLVFDPEHLAEIQDRLDFIGRLKKKYAGGIGSSVNDVIEYGEKYINMPYIDESYNDKESFLFVLDALIELSYKNKLNDLYSGKEYTVAGIGCNAFSGEKQLRSLRIPETVRIIGDNAFSECTSLQSIEFSEGLTELGTKVFFSCKAELEEYYKD